MMTIVVVVVTAEDVAVSIKETEFLLGFLNLICPFRLKERMLRCALLLVVVTLLQIASSDLLAKCTAVSNDAASSVDIDTCMSAIFSPSSFDVAGPVIIPNDATGCSVERITPKTKSIAVVNRGMCTFEMKSVMAERSGYLGLVIVNTDPSAFPVGASTETFRSSIPVVMIGKESLSNEFLKGANVRLRLSRLGRFSCVFFLFPRRLSLSVVCVEPRKSGTLPALHEQMIEHAPVLKTELLFALLVSFTVVLFRLWRHYSADTTAQPTTSKGATVFLAFVWVTSHGLMILLFLASRIVTIRLLDTVESHKSAGLEYPLLAGYNHVETDELIFETLIRAVHYNHTDYSLRNKPILHILNLPRDNYDHALFIHPPVFTYLASFLHYQGRIPLPLIPVFLQLGTLLCLPVIISSMFGTTYASRTGKEPDQQATLLRVSLRAGWLFLLCPLAWFCSQKLWIDNALVFSCTFAWMVHVFVLNAHVPLSLAQTLGRHVVSGLIFGGLSMNTKITALAMLPAFCLWTLHCEYQWSRREKQNVATKHHKKTDDDQQSVEVQPHCRWPWFRLLWSWITFGLAALAGHSPWLLWYHVSPFSLFVFYSISLVNDKWSVMGLVTIEADRTLDAIGVALPSDVSAIVVCSCGSDQQTLVFLSRTELYDSSFLSCSFPGSCW